MEAKPDTVEESPRPGTTGPGERLQAARIKKSLSVDDIASRMHLSSAIVEAIEDNNFEEITAPIFVKGYLRAYARIVGIDEDEMIDQYSELYSEEDPPINTTSNMAPELSAADTRVKWTTYLVILVLAILLGAWWWNKQQNETPAISLDATQPEPSGIAVTTESSTGSVIQADSEPETSVAVESSDSATDSAGGQDEPAGSAEAAEISETAEPEPETTEVAVAVPLVTETEESAAVEAEPLEPVAEQTEASTAETVEPEVLDETSVAPEPEQSASAEPQPGSQAQPTRTAPVGSDRLRIIVNADTWADVKDANNHQLEYNLLRADSVVDMTGQAPFTVFLGNGYGVEILYNDNEISFSSRIRGDNTARITVGN